MAEGISLRAYARRRGCAASTVMDAVRTGRLHRCLAYVNGRPRVIDAALADLEWVRNTDYTRATPELKLRAELAPVAAPSEGVEQDDDYDGFFRDDWLHTRTRLRTMLRAASQLLEPPAVGIVTGLIEAELRLQIVRLGGEFPELIAAEASICSCSCCVESERSERFGTTQPEGHE